MTDKFNNNDERDSVGYLLREEDARKPLAKRLLGYAIRYLVPLAFTILLLRYIFSKVDFRQILDIINHGVVYWWVVLTMVMSVFSHIFRAARWRLQLNALGIHPPFMLLCCSIFGTYALNLIFPRLGEVWRCTYVAHTQRASFTEVFGSMVADRLMDTITVACLILLTFIVATPGIMAFLEKYPIGQDFIALLTNPLFWGAIVVAGMLVWLLMHFLRNTKAIMKLKDFARKLWIGFYVVTKMKHRDRFMLYTLLIWGCYYFQLYVSFYAFPFTRELCFQDGTFFGLIPCLVAFVLSSIGMAVPSNGGLGPWNVAIMFGLAVYGISDAQGTAFSLVVWTAETLVLIILGIWTMGYISLRRNNRKSR